jgi:Kef-type K+ transport system membrane component KefB
MAVRLDGISSALFVPVFFLISGMRLDVTALLNSPVVWILVVVYALLMLIVRGGLALIL